MALSLIEIGHPFHINVKQQKWVSFWFRGGFFKTGSQCCINLVLSDSPGDRATY